MAEDHVLVVVEIPTGSRNKYEFEPEIDAIVLDRMLFTATRYPADYGYRREGLRREDPVRARPVGLFRMRDEKGSDEKILCVPLRDPMWSHVKQMDDLLPTLRAEIEHFFAVYKDLEGRRRPPMASVTGRPR